MPAPNFSALMRTLPERLTQLQFMRQCFHQEVIPPTCVGVFREPHTLSNLAMPQYARRLQVVVQVRVGAESLKQPLRCLGEAAFAGAGAFKFLKSAHGNRGR